MQFAKKRVTKELEEMYLLRFWQIKPHKKALNASHVDLQINDEPTANCKPKNVGWAQEFRFYLAK